MYAKAQFFLPRTAQGTLDSDFLHSDLAKGEAAIVLMSSSKLKALKTTTTNSDLSDITDNMHTKFQVMWRKYNTSDVVFTTPELSLAELVSAKKLTSDAGAKQVTTVTFTTPTVGAKGDNYSLIIADTTPGTMDVQKYNFDHTVTSDYESSDVSDITAALKTSINLVSDICKVSAASTTTGVLTLTGTTFKNHFRVAVDCDGSATINYATDLKPPTLLKSDIQQMEKDMKSHGEGITNTLVFPKDWTSEVSDIADGACFTNMGVFQFKLNKPAKHGMNAVNTEDYTLYIAEAADIDLVDALTTAWGTAK